MANKQLPPGWENKQASAKPNWGKQNIESANEENTSIQIPNGTNHTENESIQQEPIQQNAKAELADDSSILSSDKINEVQPKAKLVDEIKPLENPAEMISDDKIQHTEKASKKSKTPIVILILCSVIVIITILILALLHFSKDDSKADSNASSVATTTIETSTSETVTTATIVTTTTKSTTTQATTTTSETTTTTESSVSDNTTSYTIQVYYPPIDIYSGPGYNYDIVDTLTNSGEYVIVEESDDGTNRENSMWGKLESGIGWINLYQASITDGIGDYDGGIGEDGLGADETITTEIQPQAQTNSTIVDGVTFEYITSYVDNSITVNINSVTIIHTQDMAYYDQYEVKVDGQIDDTLLRDKYIGYYAYDAEGYQLEDGAFAKVDGTFKESYTLTVWNENTARIYIDVFA